MPDTEFDDVLHLKYDGLIASDGRMPVDELLTSLRGWNEFLNLTQSSLLLGRLTTEKLPRDRRPSIEVVAIRKGSVEIDLVALGMGLAVGVASNAVYKGIENLVTALWSWRKALYQHQVQSKRQLITIEQTAASLAQLAKGHRLEVGDDDDVAEFVQAVDRTLVRGTEPIQKSATHITIWSDKANVQIVATASERRAVASDYSAITNPERVGEYQKRLVNFRRINVDTGNATFKFQDVLEDDERGVHSCQLTGNSIHRRCDPYTGALHQRQPIEVWVRKKVLDSSTGAVRWEISDELPSDATSDNGLFENKQ